MWRRALAVLVVSACQNQGGCLLGENANLRFSFIATTAQCIGECGVLYSVMTGGTALMRARGSIPERDFEVKADREGVFAFTKTEEVEDETGRIVVFYTAEAQAEGIAKVVLNSGGNDIDSLVIRSVPAAGIEHNTPGEIPLGTPADVTVTVRDAGDRELIPGDGSVTATSSNPAVVNVTPMEGTQTYFTLGAVGRGTATIVYRAGGAEAATDVTVP